MLILDSHDLPSLQALTKSANQFQQSLSEYFHKISKLSLFWSCVIWINYQKEIWMQDVKVEWAGINTPGSAIWLMSSLRQSHGSLIIHPPKGVAIYYWREGGGQENLVSDSQQIHLPFMFKKIYPPSLYFIYQNSIFFSWKQPFNEIY